MKTKLRFCFHLQRKRFELIVKLVQHLLSARNGVWTDLNFTEY